VNAHEIKSGVVYRDAKVTATAFPTKHALESYGYRFDTPDRRIVISGDTSPTDEIVNACNACDVLIHEARAMEMYAKLPEERRSFGAKNHTTSEQLTELATRARPGLLVLYRAWISWWPSAEADQPVTLTTGALHATPDVLEKEIASRYRRPFVIGRDLDVY
jgi:Beta-lactamase superfamily domain